jgi:neutral ceramidase
LRAGFAAQPVTPPVPGPMGGYLAREGPSEGVHDDVWARAAVFEANGVKAAIVVADILCAPRTLVEEVRREAGPALGVPEHHVIVAATHTHSGPAVPPFMLRTDDNPGGVPIEVFDTLRAASMHGPSSASTSRLNMCWA